MKLFTRKLCTSLYSFFQKIALCPNTFTKRTAKTTWILSWNFKSKGTHTSLRNYLNSTNLDKSNWLRIRLKKIPKNTTIPPKDRRQFFRQISRFIRCSYPPKVTRGSPRPKLLPLQPLTLAWFSAPYHRRLLLQPMLNQHIRTLSRESRELHQIYQLKNHHKYFTASKNPRWCTIIQVI